MFELIDNIYVFICVLYVILLRFLELHSSVLQTSMSIYMSEPMQLGTPLVRRDDREVIC